MEWRSSILAELPFRGISGLPGRLQDQQNMLGGCTSLQLVVILAVLPGPETGIRYLFDHGRIRYSKSIVTSIVAGQLLVEIIVCCCAIITCIMHNNKFNKIQTGILALVLVKMIY